MGNSHSQHHQFLSNQWTHSYPRTRHHHLQPQVKVLPERLPPLRLRTTDNGAILQNGGTLSARKQSLALEERGYRPRSSSAHRAPKLDEISLDKTRFGSEPDLRYHLKESRDQFNDHAVRHRISRSRKKYKAPPAPQNGISSGVESSSSDMNGWEPNCKDCNPSGPGRKARLFKTRAETSKKNANLKKLDGQTSELSRSTEALNVSKPKYRESSTNVDTDRGDRLSLEKKVLKRSVSHEVISTSRTNLGSAEFQAELLEAAQRLRPLGGGKSDVSKAHVKQPVKNDYQGPCDVDVSIKTDYRQKRKSYSNHDLNEPSNHNNNSSSNSNVRNESSVPDKLDKCPSSQLESKVTKEKSDRDVPSKKFYFGMEENNNEIKTVNNYMSTNNVVKTNAEHRITAVEKSKNLMNLYKTVADGNQDWESTVDKFAAGFHRAQMTMPNGNTTSCSSSFVSDPDEDVDGGIALQLRPTLPKKQLEIPRFSPTAAWRLLSSIDTACPQAPSPGGSDDIPVMLEDRIHPPVVSQQGLRSSHDKSGDSGISGDASPGGCPESSSEIAATSNKAMLTQNSKNILMAWTPQQDLEEESSSDDLESPVNSSKNVMSNIPGAKFSPRGQLFMSRDHTFSMSLPRDNRMCLYPENGEQMDRNNMDPSFRLNSLQKLKGVLGTSKRNDGDELTHMQNDNWVLSRSVPSSLNNSHIAVARSISNPSSPEQEDDGSRQNSLKFPSYSYFGGSGGGGRMMYLPEYHSRMSPDSKAGKKHGGFLSKSCENILQTEMKQRMGPRSRTPSPVGGQGKDDGIRSANGRSNQKKKKFTFQSTVRLLENRRLAERLSREAELKENQRLSEVEAMKKVEEEFQKKRAREKASIRHQLRLFNLEEKNYSSLPPVEWDDNRLSSDKASFSLPMPPSAQTPPQNQASRKYSTGNRKTSTSSDSNKYASSTQILSEYREQVREYRDYRHPRYNESQSLTPENNRRSIVEHPRVVYDMPKSTAVYVSAPVNSAQYKEENRGGGGGVSTPRSSSSDNYRKDFAHGALAPGGRSLNSSDSELSQSHARSASCQRITSRRLNALHRSRSMSPDSSRSASPERVFQPFGPTPSRSRSVSPIKMTITETRRRRQRSVSPGNGSRYGDGDLPPPRNYRDFDDDGYDDHDDEDNVRRMTDHRTFVNLEPSLSSVDDYHSTFNSHKAPPIERNKEKSVPVSKANGDVLVRLGMPSLQPFNKAEKSYRPINFNPVNKLAQTVS